MSASAYTQGVCVDKDLAPYPGKYKCWWGTEGNDWIQVRGEEIGLAPRETEVFEKIGDYDSQYTHYFYGLNGDDQINGGDRADVIFGGGGHDMLFGGASNDFIYGGRGADTLYGEQGGDWLQGGEGPFNDYLNGGIGDDTLDGGAGLNGLYGGPGNDTLTINASEMNILPDDENATGYADTIHVYGKEIKSAKEIKAIKKFMYEKNDHFTFFKHERNEFKP